MDAIGIGKKNDLDDAAKDREIAKLIQQYDGPEDKQQLTKEVMGRVRMILQHMQMRAGTRTSKTAVVEQQQPQQAGAGAAASSSSAIEQQQTGVKLPPIKPPGGKK
ncbi:MAG: hypothetical protein JKY15_06620 [Deltaproteobacteria bacterium]|nr:hypothetical protein [Deltaproteobacteria bacterium]